MSGADALLQSVLQLRSEIEGIGAEQPGGIGLPEMGAVGALSFSAGPFSGIPILSDAQETVANLVASVQSILAKLAPRATLESTVDGCSARSIVDYRGQVTTFFAPNEPEAALSAAHLELIGKAYALRAAFAAALAAAGGTPPGLNAART